MIYYVKYLWHRYQIFAEMSPVVYSVRYLKKLTLGFAEHHFTVM